VVAVHVLVGVEFEGRLVVSPRDVVPAIREQDGNDFVDVDQDATKLLRVDGMTPS